MSKERSDKVDSGRVEKVPEEGEGILLVWPSPPLSLSSSESFGSSSSSLLFSDGLVVGWSLEASPPQWPSKTVVVAGVVWIGRKSDDEVLATEENPSSSSSSTSSFSKEQQQKYLSLLQQMDHLTKRRINGNDNDNDDIFRSLQVLAVVSSNTTTTNNNNNHIWNERTKEDEKNMDSLPRLTLSKGGYPIHWYSTTTTRTFAIQQLLLYDPCKVYRHDLSDPESTFGSILKRITIASSIVDFLSFSSLLSSQEVREGILQSTKKKEEQKDGIPSQCSPGVEIAASAVDDDSKIFSQSSNEIGEGGGGRGGGMMKLLEKRSFLAYHITCLGKKSQPQKGAYYWTPAGRLWHTYQQSYKAKGEGNNNNPTRPIFHSMNSSKPPRDKEDAMNELISDALDLAVGILMGLVFFVFIAVVMAGRDRDDNDTVATSATATATATATAATTMIDSTLSFYVQEQFLPQWLDWLESFPIGFKLNEALTNAIGKEIRSYLILRQTILTSLASSVTGGVLQQSLLYLDLSMFLFLTTPVILGGSGCLALLADVIQLLTMHLMLLSEGFRYVYRTELYLLGTSWRLFRGKKQNVLRNRTDTMEYDSMQLLLGSILFAMTLFLLTTILVYYVFFTLLHILAGIGTTVVLWLFYVTIQDFPFGTCYFRLRYPEVFTSRVVINDHVVNKRDATETSNDEIIIMSNLEAIPESMSSILKANPKLSIRARCFSSWIGSLLSDIFSGRATAHSVVKYLAYAPKT